jgi:hypothetical protein
MLALSTSMNVHNVFHVSLLKKYVHDPNHVIDWHLIQVETEGDFQVQPMQILDRKVKMLQNRVIELVKVQWTYYGPKMLLGSMKMPCGKSTHNFLNKF